MSYVRVFVFYRFLVLSLFQRFQVIFGNRGFNGKIPTVDFFFQSSTTLMDKTPSFD